MSLPSVMQHSFSNVPQADIPRSNFKRSHGYKTTFDADYIIPFYVDEALPGDTFNLKTSVVARLATPIAPIMDNMVMDFFFFFVPNRLIWDNFQKFHGEQINPGDSTDFTVPQLDIQSQGIGTLTDYFGLPTGIANHLLVNSLHYRAYNLIYNEWFRDQNLQDSLVVDRDDGPDTITDYVLKKRCKKHDYFTSSLPWPQKGPGVELPLGTSAPVTTIDGGGVSWTDEASGTGRIAMAKGVSVTTINRVIESGSIADNSPLRPVNMIADLSSATSATINSLREAFQLQKLYERDARGGTRYTEIIQSHFGVTSPDARLQRPEYLGGGSAPVIISQIPQTSSTDATTPQGNLAAFGVIKTNNIGFTKSFVEHGVILGLVNVRGDITYQQGINKMWSRRTRFDYYYPALAHLGEQTVLNKEIFAQGTSADDEVFGYQERWAEYRYFPSKITGLFRSTASTPLDYWHLAEEFSTLPVLNDTFITANTPVDRVIAVPSEPQFIFDSYIDLVTARPMPTYSVPGLIDHF